MSYIPPAGNAVELVFAGVYAAPLGSAVELIFSDGTGISPAPVFTFSVNDALDDISVNAEFRYQSYGYHFSCSTTLDNVGHDFSLAWSAGVYRGKSSSTSLKYSLQRPGPSKTSQQTYQQSATLHHGVKTAWSKIPSITSQKKLAWLMLRQLSKQRQSSWSLLQHKYQTKRSSFTSPARKSIPRALVWGDAGGINRRFFSAYIAPPPKRFTQLFRFSHNERLTATFFDGFGVATNVFYNKFTIPWQVADAHSWIFGGFAKQPIVVIPSYVPSKNLKFYQSQLDYYGGAILEFNKPCWAWPLGLHHAQILKGVTIVNHSINVVRLPDLANIPTTSLSIQFDIDSWAWGITLNLQTVEAMALLDPIAGEPTRIRVNLDGNYFEFIIESSGGTRQFANTVGYASGRSPLAILASPYHYPRSWTEQSSKTGGQLIDDELVNTGFSASIHANLAQLFAADWLVPGGAWSYQNKTPIEAIIDIARSVGARAYADKSADLIHIAPRYITSPWDWPLATADKAIPLSLVGSIPWQLTPKPEYNQIFVSGQNQGVFVSATRQGTAGDKPAPMITDQLITFVGAATERARNELADTGKQAVFTFDIPLNPVTGLIEPGQLVSIDDDIPWLGQVSSLSISAELGVIRQSIEVERHYLL